MRDKTPEIRRNYPGVRNTCYLNTAACGLISKDIITLQNQVLTRLATEGSSFYVEWIEKTLPTVRIKVSDFVQCKEKELALLPSFSIGVNFLANALKSRQNLMLIEGDYPTLTTAFLRTHKNVSWFKPDDNGWIDLDILKEQLLHNKIDLLAVSHIQYLTGLRLPIENLGAFCRVNEICLIADVTQSLGAVDLNFSKLNTDIIIGSTYKWLNTGLGSAIMCIDSSLIEEVQPSHQNPDIPGAWGSNAALSKFEPGHFNFTSFSSLLAAIEEKNALGMQHIESYNFELSRALISGAIKLGKTPLSNATAQWNSPIVSLPGDQELLDKFGAKNINVALRGNNLRFSPHFYNTMDDIDHALEVMANV